MSRLGGSAALRRFLILRVSRWLPTGLLAPVLVLFLLDRNLTLSQIGVGVAAMGVMVMVLELPTGGLADAIGRRRVLIMANVFELAALTILVASHSFAWVVVAFGIQGFYRALESGPLDAWYVDAELYADAGADVERGLSIGGAVLGVAIAVGSTLSGLLVWLDPFPGVGALATPFLVAIALRLVDTVLIANLMSEVRSPLGLSAIHASVGGVPTIIKSAFGLVMASSTLALVISVELFWGFGMASWENLFPARLGTILGSTDEAAALLGPMTAAAWLVSSGGAALAPWFSRRVGRHKAAAWMRVFQATTVVGMAALGGVIGLVTAYLLCYAIHGVANPIHLAMIHEQAVSSNRATVISMNSMSAMAAGAMGGIVLGAIADASGTAAGMYVGGLVLAAAAPLYIIAGRKSLESVGSRLDERTRSIP